MNSNGFRRSIICITKSVRYEKFHQIFIRRHRRTGPGGCSPFRLRSKPQIFVVLEPLVFIIRPFVFQPVNRQPLIFIARTFVFQPFIRPFIRPFVFEPVNRQPLVFIVRPFVFQPFIRPFIQPFICEPVIRPCCRVLRKPL